MNMSQVSVEGGGGEGARGITAATTTSPHFSYFLEDLSFFDNTNTNRYDESCSFIEEIFEDGNEAGESVQTNTKMDTCTWEEVVIETLSNSRQFLADDSNSYWTLIVAHMNLGNFHEFFSPPKTGAEVRVELGKVLKAWKEEQPGEVACSANVIGYLHLEGLHQLAVELKGNLVSNGIERGGEGGEGSASGGVWFGCPPPAPPGSPFIGRKYEIIQLHENLTAAAGLRRPQQWSFAATTIHRRPLIVTGLPGIGKTELVNYYAFCFCAYFGGNVIFINAKNRESCLESFVELGSKLFNKASDSDWRPSELTSSQLVAKCYAHFKNTKSLFIFDGLEEVELADLQELLPPVYAAGAPYHQLPHIIITTCSWFLDGQGLAKDKFQILHLSSFSEEDALDFFKQHLPGLSADSDCCQKLAQQLGGHPLACHEAIGYILARRTQESATTTAADGLPLLTNAYLHMIHDEQNPIATAALGKVWLSVSSLLTRIGNENLHGQLGLGILKILSFCGSAVGVPVKIIQNLCGGVTSEDLRQAISLLKKYSFIEDTEQLLLHRIVQLVVRIQIAQFEVAGNQLAYLTALRQAMHLLLSHASTSGFNLEDGNKEKLAIAEIAYAICNHTSQYLEQGEHELPADLPPFVSTEWTLLTQLGKSQQAYELSKNAANLYEKSSSAGLEIVLDARLKLAKTQLTLKEFTKDTSSTITGFESSLNLAEAELGSTHLLTLEILYCLGIALFSYRWGNWNQIIFERTRDCYKKCYERSLFSGSRSPEAKRLALLAKAGLAELKRIEGKFKKSATKFQEIFNFLEMCRSPILDEESFLLILHGRAQVERKLGNFQLSHSLFQQFSQRTEGQFGPEAKQTLLAKIKLIKSLADVKEYMEAMELTNLIYEPLKAAVGTTNLKFLQLVEIKAKIMEKTTTALAADAGGAGTEEVVGNCLDQQMAILRIKLNECKLEDTHMSVLRSQTSIAILQFNSGKYKDAWERCLIVHQKRLELWGGEHLFVKPSEELLTQIAIKLEGSVRMWKVPAQAVPVWSGGRVGTLTGAAHSSSRAELAWNSIDSFQQPQSSSRSTGSTSSAQKTGAIAGNEANICPICTGSVSFTSSAILARHMKRHDITKQIHYCEVCGYRCETGRKIISRSI